MNRRHFLALAGSSLFVPEVEPTPLALYPVSAEELRRAIDSVERAYARHRAEGAR